MNEVGFMKKATGVIAAAVAVLTLIPAPEVHAQTSNTIFPEGWDRSVRDRMFMRLGVISVNTKTKSSDAVDVTGPVISRQDIVNANTWKSTNTLDGVIRGVGGSTTGFSRAEWSAILGTIGLLRTTDPLPEFQNGPNKGLGTPPGVKAKVGEGSTVAMSLGYWLTDDFTWMLEAFVLAKPLEVKAYGAGTNVSGEPNGVSGKHIITTKMLPPLAVLSRHFGAKENRIRPFVGLGATYAILYDAKTTDLYDTYVGGETSVSIKSAFGVGPFVGLSGSLNDKWHVNVQVGQINLKTTATLTTKNTLVTGDSQVLNDFSPQFKEAYQFINDTYGGTGVDVSYLLSRLVAASKGQSDLGSFTRKQDQKLRNTIVNFSVGYSF